ncbi:restriction endonuclease subunit S [Exiguobacterium alkaliphilum]|uniref:restriction endonuclease subunit S n=1 Tax=Exiguobacterium alkaliphilum TaxID=1428684 RepID=UPI001BADA645|nr:restriction endonuclease subunit S [Exiguobacterium alkaliphilum]QUE86340.1 restriction endonuclease subunit S [Exiguobacterium alkaliphilum]
MKRNKSPEIRFHSYYHDWAVDKVGHYIEDYIEKTTSENQYPVLTSSQHFGIVLQSTYFSNRQVTTENNIGYHVLPKGYFTYRSRSDNGVFKFNRNEILDKGIISYFYPVFKIIEGDSDFFLITLNTTTKKQVFLQAEGTGQKVLSLSKLKKIDVLVPSIEEQRKIGSFFKSLDETIALHQRELDALKQTKQGFLQKMFPQNGESVPEFRFNGFTEKWNEEKLANLADFSKGSGYSKGDLITEGTPIFLYGQLYTNYKSIISNVSSYVIGKEKSVISTGSEVVVPASGESSEDIARASAITVPGIIIGGDLNIIRPGNRVEPIFLALALSNGKVQRELSKLAQGKSVVHLQNAEIKKVHLLFPEIEEQIKISKFFGQLEEVIELKEKELQALKQTKKGFLQKMFV